jgi:hypothetical protein
MTQIIRSKWFLMVVIALFSCAALFAAFGVGEMVGYHKAQFSYAWSDQYSRNFGGPQRGMFGMPGETVFQNPHGVDGTIIKIEDQTLIINGRDQREKSVIVDAQTQIESFQQDSKPISLRVGDHLVVLGDPNMQGQIVAKFIRILP